MMKRFIALSNGLQMPLLGFGTYRLKGEPLRRALGFVDQNKSYTLIDTAAVYCNEAQIRDTLTSLGDWAPSSTRFWVTSKLSPADALGTEEAYVACLKSLENLGLNCLDLYLVHWPGTKGVDLQSPQNREMRLKNWRALEKLYEEGKVRSIGVSNYLVQHLKQLMDDGAKYHPMVNQLELHPLCYDKEMLAYAKAQHMALTAYASVGSRSPDLLEHPTVVQVAKEAKLSAALVLLRWALQQNICIIPCSTSEAHINENAQVFDVTLTKEQMDALNSIPHTKRFCWDPTTVA